MRKRLEVGLLYAFAVVNALCAAVQVLALIGGYRSTTVVLVLAFNVCAVAFFCLYGRWLSSRARRQ